MAPYERYLLHSMLNTPIYALITGVVGMLFMLHTPGTLMAEDESLKSKLTPLQYHVTQQCGTEPPFQNEYWNNKREGIYIDVISGEPLFSSLDKFDSGTGWPSFTKPLRPGVIEQRRDTSHGMERVEVRSREGNAHLGHLFPDGPGPTRSRYCINSAALKFIPKEELQVTGYGEFLKLWENHSNR